MTRTEKDNVLKSCMCTQRQLESDVFQGWATQTREQPMHLHRKVWEYCYIAQALHERDMLRPGSRGLGFAVGQEPLAALFASCGCEVLATDLATEEAEEIGWVDSRQHAASLEALNQRGICAEADFRRLVSFRFLDMRELSTDLGAFDFLWSACSMEHLGSLELGERFVYKSLNYLRPGGVAVHTTEFNVSSNFSTIETGNTSIYRQRDIRQIAARVREQSCEIELDFTDGDLPADKAPDRPPYQHRVHLKLELNGFIATSFGLIIEKPEE